MLSPFFILSLSLAVAAQDRTDEASEATITDPSQECAPYYYAATGSQLSSFPTIWQHATILTDDTVAQDKYNSISGSIPTDIQPRGTATGDFSGVDYSADDPACWWTASQCTTPKASGLPADIASIPEPKSLGYGFDDGPNCSHNAFYDYLTEKEQKATMFYIGSNVMDWPLEAQRAVADGHEICVHTWSHGYMTSFDNEGAFAELYYTMQAIKLATGVTPTCWRPPFGDVDDRIRAIANGLDLETIIWKYDSFDWEAGTNGVTTDTVSGNYQSLIDNANSGTFDTIGAIMLTHELNNYTMQTAMDWYDRLNEAFDYIVPISVAQNKTQPYVETNYSMPTFEEYTSGTIETSGSAPANPSSSVSSTSGGSVGTASSSGSSPSSSGSTSQADTGAGFRLTPQWALVAAAAVLASVQVA